MCSFIYLFACLHTQVLEAEFVKRQELFEAEKNKWSSERDYLTLEAKKMQEYVVGKDRAEKE